MKNKRRKNFGKMGSRQMGSKHGEKKEPPLCRSMERRARKEDKIGNENQSMYGPVRLRVYALAPI